VDGIDALQLRNRGATLSDGLALFIIAEIGDALEHAHAAVDSDGRPLGVVHRDVKPGNILLSWAGDVKLSDFGVAAAPGVDNDRAAGTITYMAPEQAAPGAVDHLADIFALGCALHTLVCGGKAVSGLHGLRDLRDGRDVPLDRTLSADVRQIVAKALRPDPTERWGSAAAMADACRAAMADRIAGDPKGALRAFLAPFRDAGHADGASGDVLERVETGDVPRFELTPVAPGPPAHRRTYAGLIAVTALVFGALVLAAGLMGSHPEAEGDGAATTAPVAEVHGEAAARAAQD